MDTVAKAVAIIALSIAAALAALLALLLLPFVRMLEYPFAGEPGIGAGSIPGMLLGTHQAAAPAGAPVATVVQSKLRRKRVHDG